MTSHEPWLVQYLARIGLQGPLEPSLDTLTCIHKNHLLTIPFENLSVFLTGEVPISPDKIFQKIVVGHRGGWCFEQNGLYFKVLKELGFVTRTLMARSLTSPNRPRTHQIVLVSLDNEVWLTDIGFGGQPMRGPIRLTSGIDQAIEGQHYRLVQARDNNPLLAFRSPDLWTLYTLINGDWLASYEFTLEAFTPADFLVANHFHASASVSSFHDNWFVTMPTPRGRLSLVRRLFKTYSFENGKETLIDERVIDSVEELDVVLGEQFKIRLSKEELEILWADQTPPKHFDTGFGPQ